jgi:hypothetical protein
MATKAREKSKGGKTKRVTVKDLSTSEKTRDVKGGGIAPCFIRHGPHGPTQKSRGVGPCT